MNISLFKNGIKQIEPSESIDIRTFLEEYVRMGKWSSEIDHIRTIKNHKARQEAKKLIPYVTVSGTFTKREDRYIDQYSGFMVIDLDHLEEDWQRVRKSVENDSYTFACFSSVSGKEHGLCVIVKVTTVANHKDHFRWAEEHYKRIHGVSIDPSGKNVSRARYVSYDPDIYINPLAKTCLKKKESKQKNQGLNLLPATDNQINRIVSDIYNNGIDITDDYDVWIQLAFSFANHFGESGRELFRAISAISAKYVDKEVDKKFDNALSTSRKEITISTFLFHAKNAGVEIVSSEERQAITISKTAKKSHSTVESAVEAAEQLGVSAEVAKPIAKAIFESNDFDQIKSGDSIINEITTFVKLNTSLEKNSYTLQLENNGTPVSDGWYNTMYIKTKSSLGDKVTKTDVNAIIDSDLIPEYDPLKRWYDKFSVLPEDPYIIDRFLDCIPYEVPEAREFIRHWMLGVPATHAGEAVRLVLVLCGKQETGKTEFFRRMIPSDLFEYYSENNLTDSSETPLVLSKNLWNLDDEFGGKSRKDALKFKEITSKLYSDTRLKFGRVMTKLKCRSMLCGTSNEQEILNDETGNTRILPVKFNKPYDFDIYNSIDKDHLWIEIFRAYERGESWKLSKTAKETLSKVNKEHYVSDFELELIDQFLEKSNNEGSEIYSTTELKIYLESQSGQKILSQRKLGIALRKRFDQKVAWDGKKSKRGYKSVRFKKVI